MQCHAGAAAPSLMQINLSPCCADPRHRIVRMVQQHIVNEENRLFRAARKELTTVAPRNSVGKLKN
jgi:hypothetical protein